ncbi:MAG: M4 family metallopeptidase [Acidobacteria bacterium]|nr:M4 family metallopeptidase [Acidobacteriota bacterium]
MPRFDSVSSALRWRTAAMFVAAFGSAMLSAQEPEWVIERNQRQIAIRAASADLPELRRLDARVDAMSRAGELELVSRRADRQVSGRAHEYFREYYRGVPVYGGGVSRQLRRGVTESIFGTLHEAIGVSTIPSVAPADAMARMEAWSGAGPATDDPPELVVMSLPGARYVLAYRGVMRDRTTYFVNAHTGAVVWREQAFNEQSRNTHVLSSVGVGAGIRGQRKKVSASRSGGMFEAYDRLRPAEIVTLDLRDNEPRVDALLDPRGPKWAPSDVATDSDNNWNDPGVVDVHAHAGFTYDYLAARHEWDGVDGADGRIMAMVNIGDIFYGFFTPPPFGPEKTGTVGFGIAPGGGARASLDVVAHELMHAVTFHSVRRRTGRPFLDSYFSVAGPADFTLEDGRRADCDTTWRVSGEGVENRVFRLLCRDGKIRLFLNAGGAINEAFSDIVGTSVEFMVHEPPMGPLRADYVMFEDYRPFGRSLEDPRSVPILARPGVDVRIQYPEALRNVILFMLLTDGETAFFHEYGSDDLGETIVRLPSFDYDGVHWNSTILSHAFYLAIEGGENRTTGLSVTGVGAANREQVERAFVRAMTDLMPPSVSFFTAADVIRQSADDLFGRDSDVYRAIDEALTAVDLD